jgi:hypothetical protein
MLGSEQLLQPRNFAFGRYQWLLVVHAEVDVTCVLVMSQRKGYCMQWACLG